METQTPIVSDLDVLTGGESCQTDLAIDDQPAPNSLTQLPDDFVGEMGKGSKITG